jgi:hypothetical protein
MVNADDLPQDIVQPLLQLGRALMAHARAHRDTSLADHEDGVLAAWRVGLGPGGPVRLRLDLQRRVRPVTQPQADAFVTLDMDLARSVEGIVATASIDALRWKGRSGRRRTPYQVGRSLTAPPALPARERRR